MVDPQRIWSSATLPTLPTVAIRLLDLSKDPESEIKDVVDAIRTDPAITAKILKSTNSSFFGFKSEVTSIDRAVPLLGTTVVTSLALSFSLVDAAMTSGPLAEHYNDYWMQSIIQAVSAELLAEQSCQGLDCEFFLAGLLADLGRLAMLKTVAGEYLPVLEAASERKQPLFIVEREVFGFDHVEIGMKLMESWKLPDALIESVRLHHCTLEQLDAEVDDSNDAPLIRAVAVSAAVGDYYCSECKGPALERMRELTAKYYGFDDARLDEFLAKAKERIEQAGDVYNVDTDQLGDPADLMSLASEHLAQLTMREHAASTQAVAQRDAAEREKEALVTENQQLQQQALHDPLTKAYNRQFFDETLDKEISRCCRSAASVGVIFTDVDHFKQFNDTYGHQLGDEVLVRVAKAIGNALRQSDVLARYGGEEFVVLAIEPTEKGLGIVAERIRKSIEAEELIIEGERVPLTISVGAVLALPKRHESDLAKRLVAEADAAMYDSKQNGRNQVHVRSLVDDDERNLTKKTTSARFSRWLVTQGVLDVPSASKALLQYETPHVRIGVLSQNQGFLDAAQVDQVLQDQEANGERFGKTALRLGLLTEDQVAYLLALQHEEPASLSKLLGALRLVDAQQVEGLIQQYTAEMTGAVQSHPAITV